MQISSRKPLPPYGRAFLESPKNQVMIIQGPNSFKVARNLDFMSALALPPNESANSYRWPVQGRACHLVETGEDDDNRVEETAIALIRSGATLVKVSRTDLDKHNYVYTHRYEPEVESCQAA